MNKEYTQGYISEEILQEEKNAKPATCLGQTFENDNARRKHYTKLLEKKQTKVRSARDF